MDGSFSWKGAVHVAWGISKDWMLFVIFLYVLNQMTNPKKKRLK